MSTYMDFDFDRDLDEAAFAEAERAFDAFMAENAGFFEDTDDEQARYEEWCDQMELDSTEDHWMEFYERNFPED